MASQALGGRLASNQNAIREEIMLRDATVARNSVDTTATGIRIRSPWGQDESPGGAHAARLQ